MNIKSMSSQDQPVSGSGHDVPENKQTTLGLYVTAEEAYAMWRSEPQSVKIIDVRTPEEYYFVGHPEMARNVPIAFILYQWNYEKNEPAVSPNPAFVTTVIDRYDTKDTLLMICRSGRRSAQAVNALAQAGFVNTYNIIDGMEGDKVDDPGNAYHGKRMKNGWINTGVPWTYEMDPELLWISE